MKNAPKFFDISYAERYERSKVIGNIQKVQFANYDNYDTQFD